MKCLHSIFPLLIAPFFLSGIKQELNPNSIPESKWHRTISGVENFEPASEISIANTRIVEGNSGQRSVQVMVMISQAMSAPVTVACHTRNGTALAGSDYVATADTVRFSPGQIMQKITLSINGDVAVEADETFGVVLTHPVGAVFLDSAGTVTIINDDFKSGNPSGGNPSGGGNPPIGNPPIGNLAVYEVRFTFTGYTSFAGSPADCPIRPKGTVVLSGLLSGSEKLTADEDANYTGMLQMDMDIDICSAKQGASGDDAQNCGITVIGSGAMKTELKISFDARGGYITTKNESGLFMKSVGGSCDPEQMIEERGMVPNETIASVFNGVELPMLKTRTLAVGRYVVTAAEGEFVVEVLRKVKP